MSYTLKSYQEKAVEAVGTRIRQSEMVETLALYASNPNSVDLRDKANRPHGIQIEAPTGSGKTIIIGSIIKNYLQDFVVLVFSPGAGNLEEQTAKKLDIITLNTKIITESTFSFVPVPGANYVSNWEALVSMRKGSGQYLTKLSRDSENTNIFDWLGTLSASKTPVAIIVDESHHGAAKASGAILSFLDDIRRTLGYAPYLIEASATPILRAGANDGTISIDVPNVIEAGLLRKTVRLNSGASDLIQKMTVTQREDTDIEKVIFQAAYNKLQEIDKEYVRVGSDYSGLMAIQLPSSLAGKEAIERIKTFFRPLGITPENGQMALFMNGAKEGDMDIIHTPESPVRVLLYKQGISMGWDCPRAQVLVGLRHLTSKTFTTQNLGRFIRTTEARHYGNDILDSAYVYSNVGDMGSMNYDKNADHTLQYEGEVHLRREQGRYALQSINDLKLSMSSYLRKNQDPLDRKTLQKVWLDKANGSQLWNRISSVEIQHDFETIGEGNVSIQDALGHGSDATMIQSARVGVDDMVKWEEFNTKIKSIVTANGRDFGNNSNVSRITLTAIVRWFTESMAKPASEKSGREHWGKHAGIYASIADKDEKNFDLNAFITEFVLDSSNFTPLSEILEKVFSDKSILPIPEISADGETISAKDERVLKTLDSPYVLPKTLRVTQTKDREVATSRVPHYAYTIEEAHGDGTVTVRAFRQEGELSEPEKKFEDYLTSTVFFEGGTMSYVKNGLKNKDNYSLPIIFKDKAVNTYPDYLVEFGANNDFIPAIFEVKGSNIVDNIDKLVLPKAQALVELSKEYNIPAGVVFPKDSTFRIITSVNDGTYQDKDLKDYIIDASKNWKSFK